MNKYKFNTIISAEDRRKNTLAQSSLSKHTVSIVYKDGFTKIYPKIYSSSGYINTLKTTMVDINDVLGFLVNNYLYENNIINSDIRDIYTYKRTNREDFINGKIVFRYNKEKLNETKYLFDVLNRDYNLELNFIGLNSLYIISNKKDLISIKNVASNVKILTVDELI